MHIKKLLFAILTIISFSIFAQEADEQTEEVAEPAQDYLAKSATSVDAVAWTNDGTYFATSWNNSVILWNAATNQIAGIFSNAIDETSNPLANVLSLHFTNDGKYLLSVRDDNTVMIHNVDGNSDSTLIRGTDKQIPDATYISGNYRILLPLDGKNLYEVFKMVGASQHLIEEKIEISNPVFSLDATPTGRKVLVATMAGELFLIDTETWEIEQMKDCFVQTGIKPRFASDGIHYLVADNQNSLSILSIAEESDFYTLEDSVGFCFASEFSSDSAKVAVGMNSGEVKIYDIASGLEENSFKLLYGDTAKSLCFSPDDEYVIIGTNNGYIYRWRLDGKDFIPDYSGYQRAINDQHKNELNNSLLLGLGYGRLNSSYYMGDIELCAGYRNYFRPPFFWGVNGLIGVGLPGSEFPFSYREGGETLNPPRLYTLALNALIGLVYYNKKFDFSVFSEAGIGCNGRMLYNNSLSHAHTSKLYAGAFGEMLVGLQWKWVRLWAGVQYDTNLHWLTKLGVGVAIPTRTFNF
ncbi:WD40 repeat domain-containing protein [Treponema sp.]|uniref:WD40 repeat domain-containing protein n=1 Tax=Treponema sp. TaxID=166 RepID=UPI00388D0FB7